MIFILWGYVTTNTHIPLRLYYVTICTLRTCGNDPLFVCVRLSVLEHTGHNTSEGVKRVIAFDADMLTHQIVFNNQPS